MISPGLRVGAFYLRPRISQVPSRHVTVFRAFADKLRISCLPVLKHDLDRGAAGWADLAQLHLQPGLGANLVKNPDLSWKAPAI
jgi:hypothetical protein